VMKPVVRAYRAGVTWPAKAKLQQKPNVSA
jgi:hypothetical protein